MFKLLSKSNKGQALVLLVIIIPVIIAFVLYMIGLGDIIRTKIHLQNVADSAAISACVWQARGLNILVAMNNGIEACYICIAIMLPMLIASMVAGGSPLTAVLLKAIEKAWRTAEQISSMQARFARIPWSALAMGEAMYIVNKNNAKGIALPMPVLAGYDDKGHALGLYSHKSEFLELKEDKDKDKDKDNAEGGIVIKIPPELDDTVKEVNWHQRWKQLANLDTKSGEGFISWKPAKKVGKFYGPRAVDDGSGGAPAYPDEFRYVRYYPGEDGERKIVGWRAERREVSYTWPDLDPPLTKWYITEPVIGDNPEIVWPEEWSHPDEGFRWGYSMHEAFWCYKWEPLFEEEAYDAMEDLKDLISEFSSFIPDNMPLPWVRDMDIKHDETCLVLTYKSNKDSRLWQYINNILNIKPGNMYAISQARVFKREKALIGDKRIQEVSNNLRDMILSLPPYEAGLEKVSVSGILSQDMLDKIEEKMKHLDNYLPSWVGKTIKAAMNDDNAQELLEKAGILTNPIMH